MRGGGMRELGEEGEEWEVCRVRKLGGGRERDKRKQVIKSGGEGGNERKQERREGRGREVVR